MNSFNIEDNKGKITSYPIHPKPTKSYIEDRDGHIDRASTMMQAHIRFNQLKNRLNQNETEKDELKFLEGFLNEMVA